MSTLEDYTRPARPSDVPEGVRAQYGLTGFHEQVRNWHMDRLPRYTIASGRYIVCPYCGKPKDRRSMQIDHIIPIRVYVRYWLHQRFKQIDQSPQTARAEVVAANNDLKNLALSCVKCNGGEGRADLMSDEQFDQALRNTYDEDLESRLAAAQLTQDAIRKLPTADADGFNLREFILNGASWDTSPMDTRNKKRKASPVFAQYATIHNIVGTYINKDTRPAWTVTMEQLEGLQATLDFAHEEGRLCFYCLGLFKKQAFQLDHISPKSGRNEELATFNDPTNLIPVCRTCNTSKGTKVLTRDWLDSQIKRRQDERLPGFEHAVLTRPLPDPVQHAKTFREALLF